MHLFILFFAATTAFAADLRMLPSSIAKRDSSLPCPFRDATTGNLFASGGQWTASCPKPACSGKVAVMGDICATYCEEQTAWFIGREIRYDSVSPCHADSKCQLSQTDTITVTNSYSVNVGLGGSNGDAKEGLSKALNLGFSYSYSIAEATSLGLTQTQSDGYCGYWTFLPYYWASYGTLSSSPASSVDHEFSSHYYCDKSEKITTTKVYNYKPIVDSRGKAYGEQAFVQTNCVTGKKLCAALQKTRSYASQAEPDLNDPTKGWRYTDDNDCATDAGVLPSASSTSTSVPTATTTSAPSPTGSSDIGSRCSNNGDCHAFEICNGGFCKLGS